VLRNVAVHAEVELETAREGGLPPLVSLLRSPDERVQEQVRSRVQAGMEKE